MTIDQFLKQYENKSNDYDGYYGAQCFDLFQFYNRDVVGAPFVTGNGAKDIWTTYPKAFYEQIPNGATNFPVKGDVVIWGDKYGPYGHVAICTEGDVNKFTCLSQNDPAGVASIYKTYTQWTGVLGWIRPKPKVEDPLQACLRQHGELVGQVEALKKELETLKIAHEKCSMLTQEVSSLKVALLNTQTELKTATDSLAKYKTQADDLRTRMNEIHIKSA